MADHPSDAVPPAADQLALDLFDGVGHVLLLPAADHDLAPVERQAPGDAEADAGSCKKGFKIR